MTILATPPNPPSSALSQQSYDVAMEEWINYFVNLPSELNAYMSRYEELAASWGAGTGVGTPRVQYPLDGAIDVPPGPMRMILKPFFTIVAQPGGITHYQTDWFFARDADYTDIIFEGTATRGTGDLLEFNTEQAANTTIYYKIRFIGDYASSGRRDYLSAWRTGFFKTLN
jgi:hypothetical protein